MKEHLFIQDDILFITESPDQVSVGNEFENPKQLFRWSDGGEAFAFGYFKGKMVISQEGGKHSDTIAHDRDRMKFPGRIWTRKKVISFWVYPNISQLKKLLKDLEKTFNTVPLDNYGSDDFPDDEEYRLKYNNGKRNKPRGEDYGKINLSNWKIEIPAQNGQTLNDFARSQTGVVAQRSWDSRGYLYSLKTVFSGKPLKGVGEKLKKGEEVSTQSVDHVKPAMLKKDKMAKMDKRQKTAMYDYFKNKGQMSKEEERMYKMVARSLKKEDIDIYFDGKRFMFQEAMISEEKATEIILTKLEESTRKTFTLQEGTGILTEAPHISVGDKVIDLEFEKDKVSAMKNILKAIMREEITDKYGSKFKLSNDKEVNEFIAKVMKNPQVRRMLK